MRDLDAMAHKIKVLQEQTALIASLFEKQQTINETTAKELEALREIVREYFTV